MNRKVLFLKVVAAHVVVIGLAFGLMNGCGRKRRVDNGPSPLPLPPSAEEPAEIVEKEEPLIIKEYGAPGAVKASGVSGGGEEKVHEVEKGETLSGIAQEYGVPLKEIMALNDIKDPGKIRVGQKLRVPGE